MKLKRLSLFVMLLALALFLVPACGGDEEGTTPDEGQTPDKPAVEEPEDPGEPPPETGEKVWKFDADSLEGYLACLKDLTENAPKVLGDATEDAAAMAAAAAGMKFGNKAKGILEKHGFTPESFSKFGHRLWTAVAAVTMETATEGMEGLGALAGEDAAKMREAMGSANEQFKDVTDEDKAFVKKHLDEITSALE